LLLMLTTIILKIKGGARAKVFIGPNNGKDIERTETVDEAFAMFTIVVKAVLQAYYKRVFDKEIQDFWNDKGGNPFVGSARKNANGTWWRPLTPEGRAGLEVIETAEALAERVTGVYDKSYWDSLKKSYESNLWFSPLTAAAIVRKAIYYLHKQNIASFTPQCGTYLWQQMDPRKWDAILRGLETDERFTWSFIKHTAFREHMKQ